MARLIDAERFECIGFQATGEQRYDDGFADGVMFISERIDSAPTVDAVPVEWLREWQDEVGTINEWWPIIERIITVWHEEQEG